ncbi:hypothetical protein [uncultured Rikenella sp.]|uniref:hypothetical protein n=2 Tax=uncultured Rikenella sp. TaxID=368003 RepID=UPI002611F373|nr:hypothetical protein [uncultured Rikenella sp.]
MSVGNYGTSWMSAVRDIGGMFLDFYSQRLAPSGMTHRANGFQLRCLSEVPLGTRRLPASTPNAPGNRFTTSGDPILVGSSGYGWTSATNGTDGVFLDFSTQYLRLSYGNNRAPGFQLRCLSE